MVSVISHIGIGIILSELFNRKNNKEDKTNKERIKSWSLGAIGGLAPDLDIIPALLLGKPIYFYHHFFTHTILAIAIILILLFSLRSPTIMFFSIGYFSHLIVDFVDNSLVPFAPFLLITDEYGNFFSLEIGLEITEIFKENKWGLFTALMFFSYYDLFIMGISIILLLRLSHLIIFKRKRIVKLVK